MTRGVGGIIKMVNPEKGYGFILASDGSADIFFGESGIDGDIRDLRAGDAVPVFTGKPS